MLLRHKAIIYALTALMFFCTQKASFAATTGAEIVARIEKENVLAPGAKLTAAVDGSTVRISTYRHTKANQNDLKIDAVLMAKIAASMDANFTTFIVSFFDRYDLKRYKQLTVSSVALKAFGTGVVGKSEILGSLALTEGTTGDTASGLKNKFESQQTSQSRSVKSQINGTQVSLFVETSSADSETDLRYLAVQLAEKSFALNPEIKTVQVAFTDPSNTVATQVVTLDSANTAVAGAALESALKSLAITAKTGDTASNTEAVAPGVMESQRRKLLSKINSLRKGGVGVAPFLTAFSEIEKSVLLGAAENTVAAALAKLTESVDAQEQRLHDKSIQTTAKKSPKSVGEPHMPGKTDLNPWVIKTEKLQTPLILEQTEAYRQALSAKINLQPISQQEKDIRYARALQFFIKVLSTASNKQEELISTKNQLFLFQQAHRGLDFD